MNARDGKTDCGKLFCIWRPVTREKYLTPAHLRHRACAPCVSWGPLEDKLNRKYCTTTHGSSPTSSFPRMTLCSAYQPVFLSLVRVSSHRHLHAQRRVSILASGPVHFGQIPGDH